MLMKKKSEKLNFKERRRHSPKVEGRVFRGDYVVV